MAQRIIDESALRYQWPAQNMIYRSLRRLKSKEKSEVEAAIVSNNTTSIFTNDENTININGGCPQGSTNKKIQLSIDMKDKAKDKIAILYAKERKLNDGSLPHGSFKKIISLLLKSSVSMTPLSKSI